MPTFKEIKKILKHKKKSNIIKNENIVYISILAILESYYKWFDGTKISLPSKNDIHNK